MKKNDIIEVFINDIEFPNKSFGIYEGIKVYVKDTIPNQRVLAKIIKKRKTKIEAIVLKVLQKSNIEIESDCKHFGVCGGCTYRNLPYEEQLNLKQTQVKKLLDSANIKDYEFLGIEPNPNPIGYRNKMEFSFGDTCKNGELALGMRKRNSYYEVENVFECKLVDEDYRIILKSILGYFKSKNATFYHKNNHTGMLRHLVVRKSYKTQQILINLITSSQIDIDISDFAELILNLDLKGKICGILHTINDSVADIVKCDKLKVLYGQNYFIEQILDLNFKISAFSFFQTNSLGAEKLYSIAIDFLGNTENKVIFDLYCGTGTISQIVAKKCKKVYGIEIVEEAVEAARQNALLNKIDNCEFIAGDVLTKVDELNQKPDIIILDPPRDGIHPKAIDKIINFNADKIVYISCKPTSLVRDLNIFESNGYKFNKIKILDEFSYTAHVECVIVINRKNID